MVEVLQSLTSKARGYSRMGFDKAFANSIQNIHSGVLTLARPHTFLFFAKFFT